jgi:hypothetical protein
MTWKCPNCGFDANEDGVAECAGGCGYAKYPAMLVFYSESTSKLLQIGIDTNVGRRLLKSIVGEDAKYASDVQFRIFKSADLTAWAIQHDPSAKNATCLNRAPLGTAPQKIEDGSIISIGPEKAKLLVRMNK